MPSDLAADTPEQAALIADLARRYLWWEPVNAASHGFARSVAQIMNLGTYADIRRLEAAVDPSTLVAAMRQAQPGWFDARSWEFWRGRLSYRLGIDLPDAPPRRRFSDAEPA